MELNKIYNEDCLEGMKRIPGGSIDLVVTSPPYNIKKRYLSYKDDLSFEEYLRFLRKVFTEVYRVLKNKSNFLLNVGKYVDKNGNAYPLQYFLFPILTDIGFSFRQDIVWHFTGGMAATKKLTGQYENIMWLYKEDYYFDLESIRIKDWAAIDKRNNPNGKNPTDVWKFNRVAYGSKEKTIHPCQYPQDMIVRVIKGFSPEEACVLDPFIGSGTTAIACINTRRNFIGFEIDKTFYKKSIERIEQYKTIGKQVNMFEALS